VGGVWGGGGGGGGGLSESAFGALAQSLVVGGDCQETTEKKRERECVCACVCVCGGE